MEIKISDLEKLVKEALKTKFSGEESNLILAVLMFGELSNTKSHGIIRICSMGESIVSKEVKLSPEIVKVTNSSSLVNGNNNPGMLVASMGCQEAISIAKKNKIAVVGTNDSRSSSGCLAYYAEKMAREGLVGIVMARAPADVAPFGGLEKMFGTNPIAFGIPSKVDPLIFDMATSAVTYGTVARAKNLNDKLPANVAIDSNGKITTDPAEALKGAFLTFDNSYKGFGLNMMVEILAGIFTGADFSNLGVGKEWGNLFIALSPELLGDMDSFRTRVDMLVEKVRKSRSIDGNDIRIPGERKIYNVKIAREKGIVDVDEKFLNDIKNYIHSTKE